MSSGRGDLGFIANSNSARQVNKNFFGSSGHSSKKGVMNISQVSRLNSEDTKIDFTADSMISKRTEWLESQERKITATIHETKSETNTIKDKLSEIYAEISKVDTSQKHLSHELFNEIQSVYGHIASKKLKIIPSSMTVEDYESNSDKTLEECESSNEWVLLVYPMKNITITDNHVQSFMRWKRVDNITGQLSFVWAMIYEKVNGDEVRPIKEFSLNPI